MLVVILFLVGCFIIARSLIWFFSTHTEPDPEQEMIMGFDKKPLARPVKCSGWTYTDASQPLTSGKYRED